MKNKLIILAVLIICTAEIEAQSDSSKIISLKSIDMISFLNPMMTTENPAALCLNPNIEPGYMSLNYSGVKGDYHAAQQGASLQDYFFETAKYKSIKNTRFFGLFSYSKSYEGDVVFSDINNPYRETPYMLIDTSGNLDIYDREFFNIQGKMSLPLVKNLYWGSSIDMHSGLSVQDRDPRPVNKVLNIDLSEGLLYSSERFRIGANALYSFYNEEIEVDVIEENADYSFQQLLGFDIFTYHVASSYNRFYKRNSIGGEIQIGYDNGKFSTLLSSSLKYYKEKAVDGRLAGNANWVIQKDDSELEGNKISINSSTSIRNDNSLHVINVNGQSQWMIGAERIMRLEQVGDKGADMWVDYWTEEKYASSINTLGLDYSFIMLQEDYNENFSLNLGAKIYEKEQAYYLPFENQSYRNSIMYAEASKSLFLGRHLLSISAGISMKQNLRAEKTFNEGNFIVENILLPDFDYFTSNYVAESMKLSYELDMDKLFNKYFLTVGFSSINRNRQLNRKAINISTGVLF